MSWAAIVVGKGMWETTERCLRGLIATAPYPLLDEIYYADNGTPDGEDSWRRSRDFIDYVKGNVNYSRRRYKLPETLPNIWNAAVDEVTSSRIVLINNDVEFSAPGWLEALSASLDKEDVGVTGMVGMSWKDTPFIQGSLFAFRRDVFEKVGPFDPQFEFTVEEVDWCRRMALEGYRIESHEEFRDAGIVKHPEGSTRNYYSDSIKHYQYLAHLSRLRFCYKHTYPDIHIHD